MEVHIPVETIENNGLEFDHEENEWVITKNVYMNIPSHAKVTQNKRNNSIITFSFDNVEIDLFSHSEPLVTFFKM